MDRVEGEFGAGLRLVRGRLLAEERRRLWSRAECSTGLGFLSSGCCIQLLQEVTSWIPRNKY